MIKDIYATSMHGHYTTTRADGDIETGRWSYRGYGNAEIELIAESDCSDNVETCLRVVVHSAERQLDAFEIDTRWNENTARRHVRLLGEKEGIYLKLRGEGLADEPLDAEFDLPPETIIDGPSPLFLIHLMMTALPAEDREVTTPVVKVSERVGEFTSGFYRVSRSGRDIAIVELDKQGEELGSISIRVADDGCPERIERARRLTERHAEHTEIVRTPHVAETEPGSTQ